MPDVEQVTDPAETIGSFKDRWLICRDLGHAWRPGSFTKDAGGPGYIRVLRCPNCKTERHDTVNLWGAVIGRRYQYPGGYQLRGLSDHGVSRDDFRREVMRRAGLEDVKRRTDWAKPA